MEYIINITRAPNPQLHSHRDKYEIILYTNGEGIVRVANKEFHVCSGKILIVPPGSIHRYVGLAPERIYVRGDFTKVFSFREPVLLMDNDRQEGTQLARLLYSNRFCNSKYIHALGSAFMHFLLIQMETNGNIGRADNEKIY